MPDSIILEGTTQIECQSQLKSKCNLQQINIDAIKLKVNAVKIIQNISLLPWVS